MTFEASLTPLPNKHEPDPLLLPSEVGKLLHVNPKTVTRWARDGKLVAIKTMGGHRRYRLSEVKKAIEAANQEL